MFKLFTLMFSLIICSYSSYACVVKNRVHPSIEVEAVFQELEKKGCRLERDIPIQEADYEISFIFWDTGKECTNGKLRDKAEITINKIVSTTFDGGIIQTPVMKKSSTNCGSDLALMKVREKMMKAIQEKFKP